LEAAVMAQRRIGQETFRFGATAERQTSLDALAALIDWPRADLVLAPLYPAVKGEKAWPPLAMFKALLLATWYDLSDVALAESLSLTGRASAAFAVLRAQGHLSAIAYHRPAEPHLTPRQSRHPSTGLETFLSDQGPRPYTAQDNGSFFDLVGSREFLAHFLEGDPAASLACLPTKWHGQCKITGTKIVTRLESSGFCSARKAQHTPNFGWLIDHRGDAVFTQPTTFASLNLSISWFFVQSLPRAVLVLREQGTAAGLSKAAKRHVPIYRFIFAGSDAICFMPDPNVAFAILHLPVKFHPGRPMEMIAAVRVFL
jgi:Transposase domain (DUF772)